MFTTFFSHPDCRAHVMARGHPESPRTFEAIDQQLHSSGLDSVFERREVRLVDLDRLAPAHSAAHVALGDADYAWTAHRLMDVAEPLAQGRIVSCLEGSYHVGAVARRLTLHLRVLADIDDLAPPERRP